MHAAAIQFKTGPSPHAAADRASPAAESAFEVVMAALTSAIEPRHVEESSTATEQVVEADPATLDEPSDQVDEPAVPPIGLPLVSPALPQPGLPRRAVADGAHQLKADAEMSHEIAARARALTMPASVPLAEPGLSDDSTAVQQGTCPTMQADQGPTTALENEPDVPSSPSQAEAGPSSLLRVPQPASSLPVQKVNSDGAARSAPPSEGGAVPVLTVAAAAATTDVVQQDPVPTLPSARETLPAETLMKSEAESLLREQAPVRSGTQVAAEGSGLTQEAGKIPAWEPAARQAELRLPEQIGNPARKSQSGDVPEDGNETHEGGNTTVDRGVVRDISVRLDAARPRLHVVSETSPDASDLAVAEPVAEVRNLPRPDQPLAAPALSLVAPVAPPETSPAAIPLRAAAHAAHAPLVQIADVIVAQREGSTEIMLNPHELGRVKVTISGDSAVLHVGLVVERPETLDLVRRHADLLVRELRQGGVEQPLLDFMAQGDPQGSGGQSAGRQAAQFADQHDRGVHGGPAAGIVAEPARPPTQRGQADGTRIDIRI